MEAALAGVGEPAPAALVLRPEPGNARTAALLAAAGIDVLRQPLFAVVPVGWQPPDPVGFDALLLTSANAVRHAGDGLRGLTRLPVVAVGEATATAARAAGFVVALAGDGDAAAVVVKGAAQGFARLLHLAGRDRVALPGVEAITVYRSEALALAPGTARAWEGQVVLLHSARAARRLVVLTGESQADRGSMSIAALSPAVRDAAGRGWAAVAVADRPTDVALVACAVALIDPPRVDMDKRGR